MSFITERQARHGDGLAFNVGGLFWFAILLAGTFVFFGDGVDALLGAWKLPEYSHGPLIPILSAFLFLRQLKEYPIDPGPKRDRWIGVTVVLVAIVFGAFGKLANISDIVAYATIIWVYGVLLISFGAKTGWHFWPPVLHLVYMLPLPDTLYYKFSTWLQMISSELGVYFLGLLSVPVFLEGNIIDLGVLKLHVAEACSGLRYLFPILSFSYIFAVLYRGPMWHKAVLLISAAPITVFMNSVRIAVAGLIAQEFGIEWLDGFTHFFEGWVIFLICIVLLFLLARILLWFNPTKMTLANALDLETEGLLTQALRIRLIRPSAALITAAVMMVSIAFAWQAVPDRLGGQSIERESFAFFPRQLGEWDQVGPPNRLTADIEQALKADDYHSVYYQSASSEVPVELFMAWYQDQTRGGVHSPEVCLPGGGWEIAWLERTNVAEELGATSDFEVNRAIIQKGNTRMMVLYWFQQRDRKIAWDLEAKFWLMVDGVASGRTDGAIVRLTTVILPDESDEVAQMRMMSVLENLQEPLPRFIPES